MCFNLYLHSLIGIPVGIMRSAVELKICAIMTVMKKYKSIIEKKKHDKIVLLAKPKFNSVEGLFSKTLIVSNVSLDEFVLVNEVLGSTGTECVSVSAFF